MQAYLNRKSVKEKYLKRMRDHRQAGELTQGVAWVSNGTTRGCAVGCLFDAYDHSRGPAEIGVPQVLLQLVEAIFEALPRADALAWPERFRSARTCRSSGRNSPSGCTSIRWKASFD